MNGIRIHLRLWAGKGDHESGNLMEGIRQRSGRKVGLVWIALQLRIFLLPWSSRSSSHFGHRTWTWVQSNVLHFVQLKRRLKCRRQLAKRVRTGDVDHIHTIYMSAEGRRGNWDVSAFGCNDFLKNFSQGWVWMKN